LDGIKGRIIYKEILTNFKMINFSFDALPTGISIESSSRSCRCKKCGEVIPKQTNYVVFVRTWKTGVGSNVGQMTNNRYRMHTSCAETVLKEQIKIYNSELKYLETRRG